MIRIIPFLCPVVGIPSGHRQTKTIHVRKEAAIEIAEVPFEDLPLVAQVTGKGGLPSFGLAYLHAPGPFDSREEYRLHPDGSIVVPYRSLESFEQDIRNGNAARNLGVPSTNEPVYDDMPRMRLIEEVREAECVAAMTTGAKRLVLSNGVIWNRVREPALCFSYNYAADQEEYFFVGAPRATGCLDSYRLDQMDAFLADLRSRNFNASADYIAQRVSISVEMPEALRHDPLAVAVEGAIDQVVKCLGPDLSSRPYEQVIAWAEVRRAAQVRQTNPDQNFSDFAEAVNGHLRVLLPALDKGSLQDKVTTVLDELETRLAEEALGDLDNFAIAAL